MARFSSLTMGWFVWCVAGLAASVSAAPTPADALLPDTTKAFVTTASLSELRDKFNQTQLGALVRDPAMKPFMEDIERQIKEKLNSAGVKLGIDLDDLEGIATGELAIAAIQPGDKTSHAQALLVDITGKEQEALALLEKIGRNQVAKGAAKQTRQAAGVNMTLYVLPLEAGQTTPDYGVYFIRDQRLVVSDNVAVAADIAGRFASAGVKSLSSLPSYEYIMKKQHAAAAGAAPQVRWFVDPFGYAEIIRAQQVKKKRGANMIKILADQGFSALKGAGGYVFFATGHEELLHRTFVYAPPVTRAPGAPATTEKYNLAARMLDFPNNSQLQPLPWIPDGVASHLTFNWKMQKAFDSVGTLVDAIAGEKGVFEEVLLSLKNDPNGPQVDVRKGLVAHLGERATLITDYRLPIDAKCERWLVAVAVNDSKVVAETVRKAFENDPTAKKRIHEGTIIWEILQDESQHETPQLVVEGGFVATEAEPMEEEKKTKLPNSAITVNKRHLIVASHVDFAVEILKRTEAETSLGKMKDYQVMETALTRLGGGSDSFRFFARTHETYRPTYELIRQGKMPEADTLLAKALNALLTPKEEGTVRKQQIDGSKLPEFDQISKYLGPGGMYVRSEDDGWMIVGCLLRTEGQ